MAQDNDESRDRMMRMEIGIEHIVKSLGDDTTGVLGRLNGHSRRIGNIEKFVGTMTTVFAIVGFVGFLVRDIFVEWVKNRMGGH